MSQCTISPEELHERVRQGGPVDLIDVRTPAEFRELHVTFARNMPLDQLDAATICREHNGKEGSPLYVICRSGGRAAKAIEALKAAGGASLVNVEGGTLAWDKAGLPVHRGKKAMSLERQVRIAAGSLIFIGAALGFFVHPYFMGLAAFVGAGLVFAGITDTCAMGMMIAKMPWNQV